MGRQLDPVSNYTPPPEIPADVVRTCAPATPWGEIRVGDRIVYQTERMPAEVEDVVERTGRVIVTTGGREIPCTAFVRVIHRNDATNATEPRRQKDTKAKETRTMAKRNKYGWSKEHKVAWTKRVIELVDVGGRMVMEAIGQANAEGKVGHTKGTFGSWMRELGLALATPSNKLKSRARRAMEKERKSGEEEGGNVQRSTSNAQRSMGEGEEGTGAMPTEEQVEIRAMSLLTAAGKLARLVASYVEGEMRTAMLKGLDVHAAARIASARIAELVAEDGDADVAVRRIAVRQAGHLVGAYLRGRGEAPTATAKTATLADAAKIIRRVGDLCGRALSSIQDLSLAVDLREAGK